MGVVVLGVVGSHTPIHCYYYYYYYYYYYHYYYYYYYYDDDDDDDYYYYYWSFKKLCHEVYPKRSKLTLEAMVLYSLTPSTWLKWF